jgi:hypothetical protein
VRAKLNYTLLALMSLIPLGLSSCGPEKPGSSTAVGAGASSGGGGVLSSLRPKADPKTVAAIQEEEAKALRDQQMTMADGQASADSATGRVLPQVSMSPFTSTSSGGQAGPVVTPADGNTNSKASGSFSFWPFGGGDNQQSQQQSGQASYSGGYGGSSVPPPPPGGSSPGGLIPPPPPQVALNTQAQFMPGFNMPAMPVPQDPYAGYQQQAQAPTRAAGSLFASGQANPGNPYADEEDAIAKKKLANFVPITPTGMDARSPYKQRDDLKALWKGALSRYPLSQFVSRDEKLAQVLSTMELGLPPDASRGSLNVPQRTVDAVFKPVAIDKHAVATVKKTQGELIQAYYRYLYAYNRFVLAQQTVAAGQQEVEVASTAAERQRAAASLSRAQTEAEGSKEDMRSAQYELAGLGGAQAARNVIAKISGVSPSMESLAQAEASSQPAAAEDSNKGGGFLGSLFGIGKKGNDAGQDVQQAPVEKVAKAKQSGDLMPDTQKVARASENKKDKKPGKKDKNEKPVLAAVPVAKVNKAQDEPVPEPRKPAVQAPAQDDAPAAREPIAFSLKNIEVTPRKSVLKVSIRNNGSDNFSFSEDVISISEGNRKLSEASVRAEFNSTLIEPNKEVSGTITIYGRPWNDRLSVNISNNGKNIPLRR